MDWIVRNEERAWKYRSVNTWVSVWELVGVGWEKDFVVQVQFTILCTPRINRGLNNISLDGNYENSTPASS